MKFWYEMAEEELKKLEQDEMENAKIDAEIYRQDKENRKKFEEDRKNAGCIGECENYCPFCESDSIQEQFDLLREWDSIR